MELSNFSEIKTLPCGRVKYYSLPLLGTYAYHYTQMETRRLCHPLGQLAKKTGHVAQTIKVGDELFTIPPETTVHLNLCALLNHPRYWGEDPMRWDPARLLSSSDTSAQDIEHEELLPDSGDHFLPWAYGHRVCPGNKFSQVEIVATLAVLFHNHRLHPYSRA